MGLKLTSRFSTPYKNHCDEILLDSCREVCVCWQSLRLMMGKAGALLDRTVMLVPVGGSSFCTLRSNGTSHISGLAPEWLLCCDRFDR